MPYASNDQLPDEVKNVLPEAAQTIWRETFNGAYGDGEETARMIAWNAVKKAGFKKGDDGQWIKAEKPEDGGRELDMEIFSTGTWNGDEYNRADLDDIVANFDLLKDEIKPCMKLGHKASKFGQPGKIALGWAKALRRRGDRLIATFRQVPEIVYKAIQKGLYKRVSSEIYWDLKKNGRTHKRVLAAVALLGADIPAVTNLSDLEAYLTQSTAPGAGSFGRMAAYDFNTENGTIICKENEMDKQEYEAKLAEEKSAREAAEAKAKKFEDKYKTQQQTQARQLKENRTAEFKRFCEDQVKAGCMTPVARDLLCGADVEHQYSEDAGIAISVDDFKVFMEKQGKLLDTGEKAHQSKKKGVGGQYADAGTEVHAKAKAYAAEHKVGYVEAVSAVLNDDDELAERYNDEAVTDKEAD